MNRFCVLLSSHLSAFCGLLFFQLLNQFENTGPPPADKEKIQALPTVQITQEHVGVYISSSELFTKRSVKILFKHFLVILILSASTF